MILYVVGIHGLFIDYAFKIVTDKNSVGPDNLNEKKKSFMLTLNDAITAMIPAGKKKNTAKNDISIGINQSPHTSGSLVGTAFDSVC